MKKHWDILFLTFLFLSGCGQKDLPEAVPIAFKAHFKLGTEVNVYSKAPVTNLTDMGTIYICRADGTVVDYSGLNQPTLSVGANRRNRYLVTAVLPNRRNTGKFHSIPQAYSMSNGIVNFGLPGRKTLWQGYATTRGMHNLLLTLGFIIYSQLDYK